MNKPLKVVLISLLCLVLLAVLVVGGYVIYLQVQYYRIEDHQPVETLDNPGPLLQTGEGYTALTSNIGFGAYDPAYSFFMDTGVMADGTEVRGEDSRATSEAQARANTDGAIATAGQANCDFYLFQEVDTHSHRSWFIDQYADLKASRPGMGSLYTSNFHSAYLFYPPTNPHGAVESGLLTLTGYHVDSAERRSFPINESFPWKFFDLDRCFLLSRLPVEGGGELVLINLHMSAYDEGGTSRRAQLELLNGVLAEEAAKGNWVIAGGDYNHALGGTLEAFPSGQQIPSWVFPLEDEDIIEGYSVVLADNLTEVATVRGSDIPYTPGLNYVTVIDGFIVSDNVTATAQNIDAGFSFSDHNPVRLSFTLEAA